MCSYMRRSLAHSDVKGGESLEVLFDIWDTRYRSSSSAGKHKYVVSFTRGTLSAAPLLREVFDAPGRYTVRVPIMPPDTMILVVSMTTENGQYFEDTAVVRFATHYNVDAASSLFVLFLWNVHQVSLNTRFYVWIKYMLLLPVLVMCLPLLLLKKSSRLSVEGRKRS